MKKVLLAVAVATVFVACNSKKEEEKPVTPGPDTTKMVTPPTPADTNKMNPADTSKAGKTAMENLKEAGDKAGAAVKDVKAGDMKGAADNGKGAVDAAKKAVGH